MSTEGLTDPRKSHTLSEFLSAGTSAEAMSYTKLSFLQKVDNIRYCVKMILNDYLYEFKSSALLCELSTEEYLKYKYNPKMLASDIYGSTELYYVILLINDICNVRDFDFKELYLLKRDDMSSFLSKIYSSEHESIKTYNSEYNV